MRGCAALTNACVGCVALTYAWVVRVYVHEWLAAASSRTWASHASSRKPPVRWWRGWTFTSFTLITVRRAWPARLLLLTNTHTHKCTYTRTHACMHVHHHTLAITATHTPALNCMPASTHAFADRMLCGFLCSDGQPHGQNDHQAPQRALDWQGGCCCYVHPFHPEGNVRVVSADGVAAGPPEQPPQPTTSHIPSAVYSQALECTLPSLTEIPGVFCFGGNGRLLPMIVLQSNCALLATAFSSSSLCDCSLVRSAGVPSTSKYMETRVWELRNGACCVPLRAVRYASLCALR